MRHGKMSKCQTISLQDIRQLFRLLGEIRDLGCDPVAWRLHMLTGLNAILGAQVGLTGEMELPYTLNRMRPVNPIDHGWRGECERKAWRAYFSGLDISDDPTWLELFPHVGRPLTRFRDQFMSRRQWYRSEHVQRYRRASGVDSFIVSQRPLPWLQRDHLIYILRPWNDKPVEARHARMLELFHNEFVLMLRRDAQSRPCDPRLSGLGPRLRQTLSLLLAGHAEKHIAARLAISRHTVHQYAKVLYRRMRVCSRAELFAQFSYAPPAVGITLDIPGMPHIPPPVAPGAERIQNFG